MKSRAYIEYAAAKGVEWYVLDSIEELRKIVSIKPDAKLYLRIDTPNIGSDWPLAGKFGTHLVDVSEIIDEAVRLKADLAGVTFHVGSQCRNPQNWRVGIERAQTVFASMREAGLKPRLLNLGGVIRYATSSRFLLSRLLQKSSTRLSPTCRKIFTSWLNPDVIWSLIQPVLYAVWSVQPRVTVNAGCTGMPEYSAASSK